MNFAYEMTFTGPVTEKSDVVLVPYSKEYQEQYKKLYNGCYHGMREALGIKPFDFIQDNSFFAQGMENVYLLIEDGELIGSVALKGNEIDDLLVDIGYQGQGIGSSMLQREKRDSMKDWDFLSAQVNGKAQEWSWS